MDIQDILSIIAIVLLFLTLKISEYFDVVGDSYSLKKWIFVLSSLVGVVIIIIIKTVLYINH